MAFNMNMNLFNAGMPVSGFNEPEQQQLQLLEPIPTAWPIVSMLPPCWWQLTLSNSGDGEYYHFLMCGSIYPFSNQPVVVCRTDACVGCLVNGEFQYPENWPRMTAVWIVQPVESYADGGFWKFSLDWNAVTFGPAGPINERDRNRYRQWRAQVEREGREDGVVELFLRTMLQKEEESTPSIANAAPVAQGVVPYGLPTQ